MDEKIEQAIEKMAEQARSCQDSQKALHFSQAALNLAHAKSLLEGKPKKQGAGA
jgi:hypothetical protein